MAWEGLTDDEKDVLREYLTTFSKILDEVADFCEEHEVQIVNTGTMLDFGAAYQKLASSLGLGNPLERYLDLEQRIEEDGP